MSDCVFCKIVAGQIPSSAVFEDEHTFAFMDSGQVNPGHALVASKLHVHNILSLQPELGAALFHTAIRVAQAIGRVFAPEGITIYQANGKAAGQTVFHFHIHVVPRWPNDGMDLAWPAKNPARDALEANAAKIRATL